MTTEGIYVLEGPDLAGKSTLAAKLASLSFAPADIVSFGPPAEGTTSTQLLQEYMTNVLNAGTSGATVIFDRLHIGEFIYGPTFRGKSLLSMRQIEAIDALLDGIGAVKIFVDAPDNTLAYRHTIRGDDMVDAKQLRHIAHSYRDLLLDLDDTGAYSLHGWIHWLPGTEAFL